MGSVRVDYTRFPETVPERKRRLRPFLLAGWATCPTANGLDLDLWERMIAGPESTCVPDIWAKGRK